ncbi:MAG: hypothetical protein IT581_21845 [Verrucomicrobiales bacterium]|nr:hypothetical protein [Verrucomicrobiales bacterium]
MKKHLFTIVLLAAAAVFYGARLSTGSFALMMLAGLVELTLWVRCLDAR